MTPGHTLFPILLLILTAWQQPASAAQSVDSAAVDAAAAEIPDFQTQILPLLTRSGCNAGACHGAAAGRGEFRLSLFAADPAADFQALTLERHSRRIHLARPELSLLFRKACGQMEHGGGQILDPDGSAARLLLNWIRGGAPPGIPRIPAELIVTPENWTASAIPATTQLKIIARFNDGSTADVTQFSRSTSTDASAITVSDSDSLTVLRPGLHHLIIRYLNQTVLFRTVVPFSSSAIPPGGSQPDTLIDRHINQTLQQLGLAPAGSASPEIWLRRISLQLAGKLPSPELIGRLQANDSPALRQRIVDDFLASAAFTDYWTLQLARLLQLHSLPNEPAAFQASAVWLRTAVAEDRPLDQLVRQLLLASGDSHADGAAGFSRMAADARSHAELIGQAFAGLSLGCANCHNHPLDRWTQDDFHGLAAVFAPLDRGRMVQFTGRGSVTNLRTGDPATPRIPGLRDLSPDGDHREAVVDWLTSGSAPPLARNVTNRLWKHLFGRGLIEPVNDLSLTNPATHPELLTALAEELVSSHWSLRAMLRQIVLSETWGRASVTLAANDVSSPANPSLQNASALFLACRNSLAVPAEVLADAIADVCDIPPDLSPQPAARAVQVLDPARPAGELDLLGRCRKLSGCTLNSTQSELPLSAQLHLLNGHLVNARTTDSASRLHKMLRDGHSNTDIVTHLTLLALSRQPTPAELADWLQQLEARTPDERRQKLEDFLWSLLNCQEFRRIP
ncbi:MAG: DUF1549 domain-containing protein [Planctomyces sp.]